MEPLKKLVNQSVNSETAKSVQAAEVVDAASGVIKDIFDEEMLVHMKPLYLKNRTLTISCSGSTVAQELKLHETEMLKKLEEQLGQKLIDRIRYFA